MTMSASGLAGSGRAAARTAHTPRGWQWGVVAALTSVATFAGLAAPAGASTTANVDRTPTEVIVRATPGHLADAERAVKGTDGRVERELAIINGFSAVMPAASIDEMRAEPTVAAVTTNAPVKTMSVEPALGYDPAAESGSMSNVTRTAGAQRLWAAGYTGKGVDVALIDTGVAPVPSIADKVVNGPDLSFDYQAGAPEGVDAFGHGTHMAGIIGGRDADANASAAGCTTCLNSSGYSDTTKFVGAAPDARVVNVKVGASNGATDVSQVIAGIDWVVRHRKDNGLNIRVLNLSFGTDSMQSYVLDPLSYAAEVAWRNGIVVVAAAGNDGAAGTTLNDPAYNPNILAVGALDSDGSVADFSSVGNKKRSPDFFAPGAHIVSLRDPGSYIDTTYPNSAVGTRFARGSGTSQAAAVTSGLAADLAQMMPKATPDQIKAALTGSNDRRDLLSSAQRVLNGVGGLVSSLLGGSQGPAHATGTGSLDAARGSSHVALDGQALTGEQDIFGNAWDGQRWSAAAANGTSWDGGLWNGQRWSGDGWNGQRWSNAAWDANDWTGQRWSGQRWSGGSWDGQRWSGQRWSGQRWSNVAWDGQRWSDAGWSGQRWSAEAWAGVSWS
jgi:hypothetical protein